MGEEDRGEEAGGLPFPHPAWPHCRPRGKWVQLSRVPLPRIDSRNTDFFFSCFSLSLFSQYKEDSTLVPGFLCQSLPFAGYELDPLRIRRGPSFGAPFPKLAFLEETRPLRYLERGCGDRITITSEPMGGCLAKGKLLGWQSALPLSQHCWALLNSARGRTLSDKTRANPGEKVFCQQLLRYTLSLLHRHSPTCTAPLSSHTVPLGSQLRMLVA